MSTTKHPTRADYERALENIARYMLAAYTFDDQQYVKLSDAKRLRQFAIDALGDKPK